LVENTRDFSHERFKIGKYLILINENRKIYKMKCE
jgi:hypothetical protein